MIPGHRKGITGILSFSVPPTVAFLKIFFMMLIEQAENRDSS